MITNMLLEMKAAPKGEVWIFSSEWTQDWTCKFGGKINDLKVEVENTAPTLEAAVNATYITFRSLGAAVAPLTSTLLEAPPIALDSDEIPF